jgi:hypothetical protein
LEHTAIVLNYYYNFDLRNQKITRQYSQW